jgi:hypothetical protein
MVTPVGIVVRQLGIEEVARWLAMTMVAVLGGEERLAAVDWGGSRGVVAVALL